MIGSDIVEAVLDFFQTSKMSKQINATILCLIPKCDQPISVTQFGPIACCNVLYKIISKMLCNRLSGVLPNVIDKGQSAFVSIDQFCTIYSYVKIF